MFHEKFEFFDNLYSKRLENVTSHLENFKNTTSEELAEISENTELFVKIL